MLRKIAVLPLLLAAPMAEAQATPEGAAELTAVFQTYLGATPGVVTVTPDGDAYALALDAAPLLGMIPAEANMAMSVSPVEMMLTDNGDGTWGVVQDQPLAFSMAVPGEVEMAVNVASVSCEGVFDEALMAFSSNACDLADLTMSQTMKDPAGGQMPVSYIVKSMTYETSAVAGASGGVDGTTSYVITGLDETIGLPAGEGMPPQSVRVTIDSYTVDGTSTGFRPAGFLSLMAWVVSHPDEAAMTADKAGLKAILSEGLPFFDNILATGTGTGIAVETPIGPFGIAELGFDVELNGAVPDGLFREAIRLNGLTPPPGILPPFAEPLLPETASIDVAVSGFDAGAATGLLIGLLDLPAGQELGPEFQGSLMQALLPQGTVDITLAPGDITNAMYALTYEGSMTAGPMGLPVGSGTVTMTGLDAVTEALDAAPQEIKDQVLPVIGIARGLAEPGVDGALTWEIDATTPGAVLVNGMDLMGMQ